MDSRGKLRRFLAKFASFYNAVNLARQEHPKRRGGHELDHDITVAAIALFIAPDERTGEKAAVAALVHSVDHWFGRWNNAEEKVDIEKKTQETTAQLLAYLPDAYFTHEELEEIFEAALRHEDPASADQSLTLLVLMDADMCSNLMPAVIIRSAQFHNKVPPFEFAYLDGERNPASTYHEPTSVLDDLRTNLAEYLPKLRTEGGKELGGRWATWITNYIVWVEMSIAELGLLDFKP